jgi:hypothetical protein
MKKEFGMDKNWFLCHFVVPEEILAQLLVEHC